jgi:hypothetical protein
MADKDKEMTGMTEVNQLILLKELWEYLQHDSWRCGYHQKCHCGLDILTDKLGMERIPLPNKI